MRLHATPRNKSIKSSAPPGGHDYLPELAASVQRGEVKPLNAQQIVETVGHISNRVLSKVEKSMSKAGFTVASSTRSAACLRSRACLNWCASISAP